MSSSPPAKRDLSISPPSDSLQVYQDAFDNFHNGLKDFELTCKSILVRLDIEFLSLDEQLKQWDKLTRDYSNLKTMLSDVEQECDASCASRLEHARMLLQLAHKSLLSLRQHRAADTSLFVRLMMGQCNIKMWKKSDQLQFKNEYNKFKTRTTYIFILFPLLQLYLINSNVLFKIHQIWLMYYYTTLSLRENILSTNGSNIQPWWLYHHYLSLLASLIMLVWPSESLLQRTTELLYFGLFQGLVMLAQNVYQKRRAYVRKSLGKANKVDVDTSETLVEKPTDLKVLIPLLYMLYAYELYFGFSFVYSYITEPPSRHYLQGLVLGGNFIVLGFGNAITTAMVLINKNSVRRLERMIHTRLHPGSPATPLPSTPNVAKKQS